jgi:hypothetical protein
MARPAARRPAVPAVTRLVSLALAAIVSAIPVKEPARRALLDPDDAPYVVVGVVALVPPPPPAHFRLTITGVVAGEGLRPGQTIDVGFVTDRPDVPRAGDRVRVRLLGGANGLYLVCPGAACEPMPPVPLPGGSWFSTESQIAVVGAAGVAVLIGVQLWRTGRRRGRRPSGAG